MKRLTAVAVFVLLLASVAVAQGAMYQGYPVVNVVVHGRPLSLEVPAISFNGRTLIPLRAAAEALNTEVKWDAATATATLVPIPSVAETQKIAELQAENKRLLSMGTSLETEKKQLQAKLDAAPRPERLTQLEADNQALKAKVAALEAEAKELNKKIAAAVVQQSSPDQGASGSANAPTPARSPKFSSIMELQEHLNATYNRVATPAGTLSLTYDITENDRTIAAYDYWMLMEFKPSLFFLDLETKISIRQSDRAATVAILRQHAEMVYNLAIESFPGKKIRGSYYRSWYRYPSIMAGFESRTYFSWSNYDSEWMASGTAYENATLAQFHFTPLYDDAKFD